MTGILQTTSLGEIRGRSEDGVTQYLGINYATLKNRLADADLVHKRDGPTLDATKDGPTTISPSFGCDVELSFIQHSLPKKELPQSDLDCLNLNIAVPADATPSSKLPVFLFIHGGGLILGANSWPQFDYARFVRLSAEKKLPIIAVSINYRLGAFGFLTSNELRQAGYKANNGLRDQRVAMEWVQKHIHDFGGDPENVTLGGMSAGGASVTYHLQSEKALFKKAISMSGTYLLIQPLPLEVHEKNYTQAMEALGLSNASVEERIKTLLETPGQDLLAKIPPSVLTAPAVDGEIVPFAATYEQIANKDIDVPKGKRWCKDLMIGDAQMDANIFTILIPHLKNGCAQKFTNAMHTVLSSQTAIANQILEKYGIANDTSDEEGYSAILNFMNDIAFFAPTLTFAQGWRGNAYVYYFNERNPWDGPWKDRAGHILDLAYLFQNFREFLTPEQQAVGNAFAEDFFKFCYGHVPWPAVAQGDLNIGFAARVFGPSAEGSTVKNITQPCGGQSLRRSTLFDHADQVSLDDLARVSKVFMMM